jgi:Protein of unknown function (DUF2917)
MPQIASISSQHSASCLAARSGAYLLAPAQALGLRPQQASSLRITCGQAWVTFGDGMDHFLQAGQTLHAPAGSHVVLESLYGTVLKFDWQAEQQPRRERSTLRSSVQEVAVQAGLAPSPLEYSPQALSPLAQALLDLRGAAVLAARGLAGLAGALAAGLVRGLGAGLADFLTGGLAARARSAHSSASAAQGRMAS